jgi:hypothetical protein
MGRGSCEEVMQVIIGAKRGSLSDLHADGRTGDLSNASQFSLDVPTLLV